MTLDSCRLDQNNVPLPPSKCPRCGNINDRASRPGNDNERPQPGDFSVCIRCGTALVFQEDMTTREAELNDLMKLSDKERFEIGLVQATIKNLFKKGKENYEHQR